mmetsp:Transcript_17292/g.25547  ORF Transcript_17292/g.25547 Transcript_17292/m.25547 type:complete len:297 (-) Transcript_17292:266-1156(-)
MKNEQYSRIHSEEHEEHSSYESDHAITGDIPLKKIAWMQSGKGTFQPLSQCEHDEDSNDHSYKKSRTSTPIISPNSSEHGDLGRSSFSDYDSDDNEELQRYQLDFSDTSLQRKIRASNEFEDSFRRGKLSLSLLWQTYEETRAESKRKHVEALLSVNTKTQRWFITIESYCDLYDRGIPVLLLVTATWLILTILVLNWKAGTYIGCAWFFGRIIAKPFYWYIQGRYIARKRKQTMEIYKEITQIGIELGTPAKNKNTAIKEGMENTTADKNAQPTTASYESNACNNDMQSVLEEVL